MNSWTIATRKSPLALWQARHVARRLEAAAPGCTVKLLEMTTAGDRFLQAPLSQVGGKGLFVKEIEQAVLAGEADLAVHSLKDMTSELAPGLCLAAVPRREDARDAFIGLAAKKLEELPDGAAVGTSSLRRSCQLLERRPDLRLVSLRGNVETRLRKASEEKLGGTVLAYAGLKRLGLEAHVTQVLSLEESLPAVGQGALAIECREADQELRKTLARLEDSVTRLAITAERGFLAALNGGCSVPLAGHAMVRAHEVILRGLIGRPDGKEVVRGEMVGPVTQAEALGRRLAQTLLDRGGREILERFASQAP